MRSPARAGWVRPPSPPPCARLYAAEGRPVLAADVDPDANLGLALGLSQEEVDAIVPISKMRTLVEERTGANAANKFFKLNP